jgi:hypothetical protein
MIKIQDGWRLHSADFSVNAIDQNSKGYVILIREFAKKEAWYELSDYDKKEMPLHVSGSGFTIEEAIKKANLSAFKAKDIK